MPTDDRYGVYDQLSDAADLGHTHLPPPPALAREGSDSAPLSTTTEDQDA